MRRRLAVLALAAAALLAAAAPTPAERTTAAAAATPAQAAGHATAVGVSLREFRIAVYRRAVRRGVVRFNVRNRGEDTHNFVVRGPRGFRSRRIPEIRAGRSARLTVRLRRPGAYRLLCTTAGHHRIGMVAELRVRR